METASLNDRLNLLEFQDQPAIAHLITRYFETLNNQEFAATASLFASDGVLFPPFDGAMVGRKAIVTYLEDEAQGLQLFPLRYSIQPLEQGQHECQVGGKVQTPLFTVNVCWEFRINSRLQIASTRVNLMASMEELLKLRS